MTDTAPPRSTAEARRASVLRAAVSVFAGSGYHATPVADVAEKAQISPAYVFRLFKGKIDLFVAALDRCYLLIGEALEEGAGQAPEGASSAEVLDSMGDAYADLIADRDLLMLQVHAQSVTDIPEVREALRRGYAHVVNRAFELSGGTGAQVQNFVALGQLCHLIVATGLDSVDESWARTVTKGMRHVPSPPRGAERE